MEKEKLEKLNKALKKASMEIELIEDFIFTAIKDRDEEKYLEIGEKLASEISKLLDLTYKELQNVYQPYYEVLQIQLERIRKSIDRR